MNRYESYENTGLDWVPEIPEHWSLTRSKFIFRNKSVKNCPDEPLLSVTQKDGVVLRSESDLNVWNPTEDVSGYKLIEPSNFVISLRSFEGGLELSTIKGIVSPAYTVLEKTKKINDPYFRWLMKSHQFIIELNKHVTGIRQGKNIGWDDFSNIYLTVPPIEEQELISRYLDQKTEQIDSLIEKIEKKIELLKEQRTSLINHCVTKGLDPNVEMKDSGIEWIGEIPSHWILSKFGFVASLETGNTPSKSEEDLYFTEDQNGFLWVKPSDLDVGFQGVSDSEVKLTFEGREQSRVIPKDSILVCCIGNTSGKYSIANCDLSTNQQINSITFKDQIFPRYGLYYMDVFGRDLLKWMNFVTLPIISKGDLSQQPVIVPPKSEQIEISGILDKIISEHKVVTELHLQKIQLLKEYRQSLISSVVTGKVRVTEEMV